MKRRGDHVELQQVLALAEGTRLPSGAAIHLERCADCAGIAATMEALVEDMRSDRLVAPTEATLMAAIALFPSRPPLLARVLETVGRLVRGGDELRLAAAAGIRGEAVAPLRLLFAADDLFVDLEVEATPADGVRLTGQVFGRPPEALPALVSAEQGSVTVSTVPVGDQGVFSFERLPGGPLDLVLDLGERHVRLQVAAEPR